MESYFPLGNTISLAGYHVTARDFTNTANLQTFGCTAMQLAASFVRMLCRSFVRRTYFSLGSTSSDAVLSLSSASLTLSPSYGRKSPNITITMAYKSHSEINTSKSWWNWLFLLRFFVA